MSIFLVDFVWSPVKNFTYKIISTAQQGHLKHFK